MTKKRTVTPPYLGAAYYPEDWPVEQIDEDIALMRQAGMNVMRIGEFAWARMEPQEGCYDFDWIRHVVGRLAAADIATIMCTPTATPPAWLATRHPEILFVDPEGTRAGHGGRRHTCPNSPVFRRYCARIVEEMANVFGNDERIIGWQIDNEVMSHYDFSPSPHSVMRSCCCPVCLEGFRNLMKERYGTIEELNRAWCLNIWSQKYDSFEQLPPPSLKIWHHPALLAAWDEFNSRSYVDFVQAQADILQEKTIHPIGTDMMPVGEVDHYAANRGLDVVQFNHYDYFDHFRNAAFWFDYMRPIKERPFWNTETSTCWVGSVTAIGYIEPGYCRANSWLPIALGAEANLFWLWRTHWAGQELQFGSVVSSQGRPMHVFGEVQEVATGLRRCAPFLNGTRPEATALAIQYTHLAYVTFKNQPANHGFQYPGALLERVYHPLIRAQYRPDVVGAASDLSRYRVIIGSLMPVLDDGDLRKRIEDWIKSGGIWIAGPLTDCRTADGAKFRRAPYGSLEEWGGIYCKYQLPAGTRAFSIRWKDDAEGQGALCYDGFELRGAEALAVYTENELAGLAAITRKGMGEGQIIVMGTMPPPEQFVQLVDTVAKEAGVERVAGGSDNVLCAPRSGAAGEGAVLVELDNRPGSCVLPRPGVDLLTGERVSGTIEIPPYGVAVIQY